MSWRCHKLSVLLVWLIDCMREKECACVCVSLCMLMSVCARERFSACDKNVKQQQTAAWSFSRPLFIIVLMIQNCMNGNFLKNHWKKSCCDSDSRNIIKLPNAVDVKH